MYGQLMIVNVQGVGSIFTDPQIHSLKIASFGQGNLSKGDMTNFFAIFTPSIAFEIMTNLCF